MTILSEIVRKHCCAGDCRKPGDCMAHEFEPFVRLVIDAEHAILEAPENVEHLAVAMHVEMERQSDAYAVIVLDGAYDRLALIRAILHEMREISA